MPPITSLKSWLLTSAVLTGCSSAEFAGNDPGAASQKPLEQKIEIAADNPSALNNLPVIGANNLPTCSDGLKPTGVQLAFVVDNSGSNTTTDCPARSLGGALGGQDLFATCSGPTAREKAILETYDMLAKLGAQTAGDALSQSQLAIASFPTRLNEWTGWEKQVSWQPLVEASRVGVANNIRFTRSPQGLTPYSAALSAASSLFTNSANDKREKVAVLISDGQATDSNPAAVEAQAEALKAQGVKVYVVIYGGTLAANADAHIQQMTKLQDQSKSSMVGNWYASNYASFDDYLKALVGNKGESGLAAKVAGPDHLIELDSANNLAATIRGLVATQAVKCAAR